MFSLVFQISQYASADEKMRGSSWSKQGRGFFSPLINGRIHYETKKTYCGGSRLRRHPKNSCLANKESTHKYSPNISLVALCTILVSSDLIQKYAALSCMQWKV